MMLLDRLPTNAAATPVRSRILREFVMRQDRPASDQRVDLPEIQESFRVSFSDAALMAFANDVRTDPKNAQPTNQQRPTERQLHAYLAIAEI